MGFNFNTIGTSLATVVLLASCSGKKPESISTQALEAQKPIVEVQQDPTRYEKCFPAKMPNLNKSRQELVMGQTLKTIDGIIAGYERCMNNIDSKDIPEGSDKLIEYAQLGEQVRKEVETLLLGVNKNLSESDKIGIIKHILAKDTTGVMQTMLPEWIRKQNIILTPATKAKIRKIG